MRKTQIEKTWEFILIVKKRNEIFFDNKIEND